MRKTIVIILAICFVTACKTSYTVINDRQQGVSIILPKGSKPIDSKSLENKYSEQFYMQYERTYPPKGTQISTWDYTYQIGHDIIIGFNYGHIRENEDMEKEWNDFQGVNRMSSNGINYKAKEEQINNRLFWLGFQKKKDNDADYFVHFRSDMGKSIKVLGVVRFPANYGLEEIEKQTTQILSGVKFEK